MNIKLENKLCKEFPELFKGRYMSPQESLMCFGCECGDGWYNLIRNTCKKLKKESEKNKLNTEFSQIKEKYGLLRMSVFNGNDEIWNILEDVEIESGKFCEICGIKKNAFTIDWGWIKTLCPECFTRDGIGSRARFWVLAKGNKEEIYDNK